MTSVGEFREGRQAAMDRVELDLHSLVNTHLDALSHVGHLGRGFNGVPFEEMVDDGGARRHRSMRCRRSSLALLVDVARPRGVDHLEPGDHVRPEELEVAADQLEPGDVLLVRTGRWSAPRRLPGDPGASGEALGDWAGCTSTACSSSPMPTRALLGTDSTTDTFPSPTPDAPSIHMLAEVYLGLPLLHSMDLDAVARGVRRAGPQRGDVLRRTAAHPRRDRVAGRTRVPDVSDGYSRTTVTSESLESQKQHHLSRLERSVEAVRSAVRRETGGEEAIGSRARQTRQKVLDAAQQLFAERATRPSRSTRSPARPACGCRPCTSTSPARPGIFAVLVGEQAIEMMAQGVDDVGPANRRRRPAASDPRVRRHLRQRSLLPGLGRTPPRPSRRSRPCAVSGTWSTSCASPRRSVRARSSG